MCDEEYIPTVNETLYYSTYYDLDYTEESLNQPTIRLKQNSSTVLETSLKYLSSQEQSIFFSIYLILYVMAVVGNIAAIIVTWKRKHRCIQKTCVISLALSDFIAATAISILHLYRFSEPLLIWSMGSFMCSFLPSVPVFGSVCSSTALVGIALDRYRSVVHALKRRWNPELWLCILSVVSIWCLSIAISYPMFTFFKAAPIRIVSYDEENEKILYRESYMCITFRKNNLQIYYICIICLVFLPLFIIFFWLYYKIASIIWKHRKPLSHMFQKKYEPSTTVETSTSHIKPSEEYNSRTTSDSDVITKSVIKSKNARVQRKVRTFKIIIFLMFAFMILRLPSWIYDTLKLSYKIENHAMWITKFICTALILLHCALNPFLYTFLNQTLDGCTRICTTLKNFMCEVCCCCFSTTEFEEFQNQNPFIREEFKKRIPNVNESSHSNKTNPKSSRVKFDDLAVIKVYPGEESYKEYKKY